MTILLKGTNIGTATDETGHFFLKNLPEGKYTLRVQGVGYKSAEKEIVIVRGKTQEVNFEISEDAVMLDGAVVTANRNETDRREAPRYRQCTITQSIREHELRMFVPRIKLPAGPTG